VSYRRFASEYLFAQAMAYELHIERLTESKPGKAIPIPLDEWKAAVAATPGVRLCTAEFLPLTMPGGATLNIPLEDGATEVSFPDTQEWQAVFRWHKGTVSFRDTSHPVWTAAVALASRLQAAIRGDDGEAYDFQTGEVIDT